MVVLRLTCCVGKKSARTGEPEVDAQEAVNESDEGEDVVDTNGGDLSEENVLMVESPAEPVMEHVQHILPQNESRRGTFTFTVEEEADPVDELPHQTMVDAEEETPCTQTMAPAEDVTITRLFQSPAQDIATPQYPVAEEIEYPELPHSDRLEDILDAIIEPQQGMEATPMHTMEGTIREDVDVKEISPETTMVYDERVTDLDTEKTDMELDIEVVASPASTFPPREVSNAESADTIDEVVYPALPTETLSQDSVDPLASPHQQPNTEDIEITEETYEETDDLEAADEDALLLDADNESSDDEFTEASLQLDIFRDYQDTLRGRQLVHTEDAEGDEANAGGMSPKPHSHEHREDAIPAPAATPTEDIADGLTFSFTPLQSTPAEPTPRKLSSPPAPIHSAAEDATMTIALDDDTALLKSFLSRAAASKAEKAAVITHRRESLQNRRDSDVVRNALSSPRKILDEKDPNSPSKYDAEPTLELSQNLLLSMGGSGLASPTLDNANDAADDKSLHGSRRSSRTKKSRLPAPASATPAPAQTSKISIRRADGTDHVVLKKSDAQELATLTKANTRKNKQGAFGVTVRLLKLAVDAASLPPLDDSTRELVVGKNIRWDEQLAYYQESPETVAEAESLATPDELGMSDAVSTPSAKKSKVSKNSTPKIRRVRGLGTANGTPGKVLLAPESLLPEDVQEEKEAAPQHQLPKPKASKIKKMPVASSTSIPAPVAMQSDSKLPSLDITPVGVTPTKPRASRLAAPKKVVLPQPSLGMPADGKENAQRTGLSGATPKKGIPAPKVNVPTTVGMESGLPRRRGRKI